ncbi:RIBULOSE-phosphate 3-epimerase [Entomophthora muscae]|uniref:RIBULOSE-phosphate 3-epimerase n=1 Tax=Entomophthora muscae TaxID=34485 RepID=A0ACC2TBC5_9FUNG|nr:RIBULOSE-phosphate 3-epimerase [Entomophthora muscae]
MLWMGIFVIKLLLRPATSHFVPNLTLGAPIISSVRKHTNAFLDCHLMVSNPSQWVSDFGKAGASMFTFHIESVEQPSQLIQQIHDAGMKAGIAVKPKTPVETVLPFCSSVDMILIMTVEPGFGGQSFMPEVLPKVTKIRQEFPDLDIQVDGGLGPDTIEQAAKAGANVIVAGTSVFKADSPAAVIKLLRDSVNSHN